MGAHLRIHTSHHGKRVGKAAARTAMGNPRAVGKAVDGEAGRQDIDPDLKILCTDAGCLSLARLQIQFFLAASMKSSGLLPVSKLLCARSFFLFVSHRSTAFPGMHCSL